MSEIDWSYWANLDVVNYRDACILSCGYDPKVIVGNAYSAGLDASIKQREAIAKSHLGRALPAYATDADRYHDSSAASGVKLAEFHAWGRALPMPLTFPGDFPKPSRPVRAEPAMPAQRWPWGDHETEYLQLLEQAASRFWTLYDPADATTAPTNDQIEEWLKQQTVRGEPVSARIAGAMATILRADGLPNGPRK